MTTVLTKTESVKATRETEFAQKSAKLLKDIVTQNGWAIKLGQGEHLKYEAWQTVGKYYGYTVKTHNAVYVEYGAAKGFEAKATVIDTKTGAEIGGAEAICLNDEFNWKTKPLFQLKSMAQTRAGSKALRQILGFVVALAGYSPTPAEEMDNDPQWIKSNTPYDLPSRQVNEDPKPLDELAGEIFEGECTCGTVNRYHRKDCPRFGIPPTN